MAVLPIVGLVGCGGGAANDAKNTDTAGGGITYTAPTSTGDAPVIQLNSTLSTGGLVVFDVVGANASRMISGLVLNLQVDATKLVPIAVPGVRDPEPRHLLASPIATTGGFGQGTAIAVRKDRGDGTSMMAVAIRKPSPPMPCSGVLLRFAYQVSGTPVQGVIRTQVQAGSGVTDNVGHLVAGTSVLMGRLEFK